ncbi:protein SSUH2 homolog isoform X2 [Tachypleus tridentatus]|uniref:protein SSUH2 homolog isoform X2 n=1 Tax=Tachypleus tridentatus TaxID=6853 RepID=UPI003FD24D9C
MYSIFCYGPFYSFIRLVYCARQSKMPLSRQSGRDRSSHSPGSSIYRRQGGRRDSGVRPASSFKRQHSIRITPPPDAVDDEPEPTAPPVELMDKVDGYEYVSFDVVEVPPPTMTLPKKEEEEPERASPPSGPQLTEQEARQALLKYVSTRCCYGKSAARDMAITKIEHSCAFHYTLETFSEKRQTAWAFEPYAGGTIDSSSTDTPPGPWEIFAVPSSPFMNSNTQLEVPHTASIKTCHTCGGVGRKRCYTCSGNGYEQCYSCHGDGYKNTLSGSHERCFRCHGIGRRRCWKCNGDGLALCKGCAGTGQIKCYIRLTVAWMNHTDEHVVEHSAVPDEKIKSGSGQVVFEEEDEKLWPINHFPNTAINMASVQLIQQHATAFPAEKVLRQRQRVRIIPVTTVHYQWKNHNNTFCVFGFEKKVYAPKYPQTCCCACTVL